MQIVRSGYPMERIAVDILGELPRTENGNKYILVVGDYFTKWVECFPIPNMEAVTAARILIDEVIASLEFPREFTQIKVPSSRVTSSQSFASCCR